MGYLAGIAAYIIWGLTSSVLIRIIPLQGPVVTTICCAIGALTMLGWIGPRRWHEISDAFKRYPWRMLGLAFCFGGCSLTFQWAVKTTTVANAVLTHSLQPLITCLVFVPLVGGRKPDLRGFLALIIGISGLALVLWPELAWDGKWFGIIMGAASAVLFGWFNVQFPWFKDGDGYKVPLDVLQCCTLLGSIVVILPVSLTMEWSMPGPVGLLGLAGTGLFSYVVANRLYLYSVTRVPVGSAATLAYVEPVISIGAAALFLGEALSANAAIGGMLVLLSGALVVWESKKA